MSNKVEVVVAKAADVTRRIVIEEGASVELVLKGAGIRLSTGEGVSVNGAPAQLDQQVQSDDIVTVSKGAKGA